MSPIFASAINLTGLYSNQPVVCCWSGTHSAWVSDNKELLIKKPGIVKMHGNIIFSSHSKVDVENWILGVRSCTAMLKNWAIFSCLVCDREIVGEKTNLCVFCESTDKYGEIDLSEKKAS